MSAQPSLFDAPPAPPSRERASLPISYIQALAWAKKSRLLAGGVRGQVWVSEQGLKDQPEANKAAYGIVGQTEGAELMPHVLLEVVYPDGRVGRGWMLVDHADLRRARCA